MSTPAAQADDAAAAVVARVAARLTRQGGAAVELGQLARLSPDEVAVLVRLETDGAPTA